MVLWWNSKPARSSAAGMARCPPSSPSSANSPRRARSAKPGTSIGVGRLTARPSAAVNSALVTGAGPVALTGPASSSCPIANNSARTSSSRLIHGMYWRPLPSRAPSPRENSGFSRASMPPVGDSTSPVRTSTTRTPALLADSVAASQSWHRPARKPWPAGADLVEHPVAGVPVVAHRARVDEHRNARLDDGTRQHLGRADPAVAQALLEGARPPLAGDADAAHVHDGVRAAQCARVELAGVGIPEDLVGVRRCAPHQSQHPVVRRAQRRRQRRADESRGTRYRDDGIVRCRRPSSVATSTVRGRPRTPLPRDDA